MCGIVHKESIALAVGSHQVVSPGESGSGRGAAQALVWPVEIVEMQPG